MGEKLKPKRSPEANEAYQAARAAKRERAKDDRIVALIAGILMAQRGGTAAMRVTDAGGILFLAKGERL